MAFELVEFCEPSPQEGQPFAGTLQTIIGTYDEESEAIERGRDLWKQAKDETSADVMWWIVRAPGETLARWIADKGSEDEQILDLRTNQLVRVV